MPKANKKSLTLRNSAACRLDALADAISARNSIDSKVMDLFREAAAGMRKPALRRVRANHPMAAHG